jgi:ankyrin repeat protein
MELMPTLEYLMSNGATFNIKDSKGRDVMSYAIENNDLAIVKYLISHASTGKLLINN